jgi:HK97 family phage prohead protease
MIETKFCRFEEPLHVAHDGVIEGYASLFDVVDRGGDIVCKGAYELALANLKERGGKVKMLWQHDPAQPIGVWDIVQEDTRGLYVEGYIIENVEKGREALALIKAGALDGLSIGYRTKRATKSAHGGRMLQELDLWEVSLVTFPMLETARINHTKKDAQVADMELDIVNCIRDATRRIATL